VREKFSCQSCETITRLPAAPFHVIARGRVGPGLLETVMHAKFGEHQPLNRQSECFFRASISAFSTLADWVGTCTTALSPLVKLLKAHVLAAERLHGDETTVPVLAKDKTITARFMDLCARR
jgi:transposase